MAGHAGGCCSGWEEKWRGKCSVPGLQSGLLVGHGIGVSPRPHAGAQEPACAWEHPGVSGNYRLVACGRHSSTTCALRVQTGGTHPANLATNQAKGLGLSIPRRVLPVEPDAMRVARPDRRRLAGLTPLGKRETNPCVLSDGVCASQRGQGDADRPPPNWKEAVMTEVVQIHTRGFGPKRSAQPWPAWGAQTVATRLTGVHQLRRPEQISARRKAQP